MWAMNKVMLQSNTIKLHLLWLPFTLKIMQNNWIILFLFLATRMILWFYFIGFRTYSYNNLDRGNIWMYDEEICKVWFSFTLDSYYQQNSISDKGTWLMDDMIEAHVWEWGQWLWRFSDSTISYFIIFA